MGKKLEMAVLEIGKGNVRRFQPFFLNFEKTRRQNIQRTRAPGNEIDNSLESVYFESFISNAFFITRLPRFRDEMSLGLF